MKPQVIYLEKINFKSPTAIVAAQGLRSVGKIALNHLIRELKPKLFAEFYSRDLPAFFYGISYLSPPSASGVLRKDGFAELPCIRFYAYEKPELIITEAYQASDTLGQYETAWKVVDLFEKHKVAKIIILGAHTNRNGLEGFATDSDTLSELRDYKIKKTETDRFIGLSGLVLGIGMIRGIRGFCLLGETSTSVNPEDPDPKGAKMILDKLKDILKIDIDTSELEEKKPIGEMHYHM
ncbi:MAG: PAC2 family protein [Candidatus Hydrothermarchaeota archaeon]